MKHVVITGTSSGIGRATAGTLLERGYRVFGSVRSAEDEKRLAAELGERFVPLRFDVTDGPAVTAAAAQVGAAIGPDNLTALINNAGIVRVGPLQHLPVRVMREQLEVNVLGVLQVSQAFLPLLGARRGAPLPRGRIINISSVSGKIGYPFMGAYAASKHALEGLSDSLRRELLLWGVDVIQIEPGNARTPLFDKALEQIDAYADTPYAAGLKRVYQPGFRERLLAAMPVERVTREILRALEDPRPRARYPVPGRWLVGWLLPRLLPVRLFDRLVADRLGLTPRPD
jgi:NAD(P)-dependent dehydrogenase (short-subunit alcohol dehydrogenase family)